MSGPAPAKGGVALVLGTRPEIIKLSPVARALDRARVPYFIVHTNQHYSPELDRVFFEELELAPPGENLDVGSGSHGVQTGRMLERLEAVLDRRRPTAVLVQGDTNSVLAGALVAAKLLLPVGHVEAGLRSGDRTMPEELNRIVADHLSTWWFAPTPRAVDILAGEGIVGPRVVLTGNTVVDAALENGELAARRPILERLGLEPGRYFVLTLHRAENTDRAGRLSGILDGLERVLAAHRLPLVFPVHPRSEKMFESFGLHTRLAALPGLRRLPPVGYLDFLRLEREAALALTDSGGVQEEACIFGVPCVTLRDNTERPETVEVGANRLAGADPAAIAEAAAAAFAGPRGPGAWPNPFGDGRAGARIVDFLARELAG